MLGEARGACSGHHDPRCLQQPRQQHRQNPTPPLLEPVAYPTPRPPPTASVARALPDTLIRTRTSVMTTFDKAFRDLLAVDAARKGIAPAVAPQPAEPDEEEDEDDLAEIDGQIMRSSRRYRRGRDPDQLTDRHVELARRLAQGIEPPVAARTPPLRYRLRAIRSLLATPLFVAAYEALRHERSPTVAQLREAVRPHHVTPPPTPINAPSPPRPISPGAGYLIRLRPHTDP